MNLNFEDARRIEAVDAFEHDRTRAVTKDDRYVAAGRALVDTRRYRSRR